MSSASEATPPLRVAEPPEKERPPPMNYQDVEVPVPASASSGPTWIALVWKEVQLSKCDYILEMLQVTLPSFRA